VAFQAKNVSGLPSMRCLEDRERTKSISSSHCMMFTSPLSFIEMVTTDVLIPLATEEQASTYFTYGFDVLSWLNRITPCPSAAYMASIPILFLFVCLTQFVQHLVTCEVVGLTPGELRGHIAGTTWHSQGIIFSGCYPGVCYFEPYNENSKKALRWLFNSGFHGRGQEAFPIVFWIQVSFKM
jgi:fatty acid synthase subunit alpha, fungi type